MVGFSLRLAKSPRTAQTSEWTYIQVATRSLSLLWKMVMDPQINEEANRSLSLVTCTLKYLRPPVAPVASAHTTFISISGGSLYISRCKAEVIRVLHKSWCTLAAHTKPGNLIRVTDILPHIERLRLGHSPLESRRIQCELLNQTAIQNLFEG